MGAEIEIGGEEKRRIGTCAVQGKAFKPIILEDCFSVIQRQRPVSVPRLKIPRNWEPTSRKTGFIS